MLPVVAKADTVTIKASGTCGDSAYWKLTSDGTLTIYGSGDVTDYKLGKSPFWSYMNSIVSIVVEEGITSLGSSLFYYSSSSYFWENLLSVSLPSSLLEIGDYCFAYFPVEVPLSPNLQVLGEGSFLEYPFESLIFPDSLISIGGLCFARSDLISVDLGSYILFVGGWAFQDCTSLTSFSIGSPVPPEAGGGIFQGCLDTLRIYVPDVAAYESAVGWSDYAAWIVGGYTSGGGAGSAGGSTGGGVEDTDNHYYSLEIYPEAKDRYYLGSKVQFYADFRIDGVKQDIDLLWSTNEPGNHLIENGLLTIADDPKYANAIVFCKPAVTSGLPLVVCESLTCSYEIYLTFMTEEEANKPTVPGESAVLDAIDVLALDVQLVQNSVDLLLEGDEISAAVSGNLGDVSQEMQDNMGEVDDFQQSQMDILDDNMDKLVDSVDFSGFIPALEFIMSQVNNIFDGLGDFSVVLTLPLYLGLFFYICSRVPGGTVPKVRRLSRSQGDNT